MRAAAAALACVSGRLTPPSSRVEVSAKPSQVRVFGERRGKPSTPPDPACRRLPRSAGGSRQTAARTHQKRSTMACRRITGASPLRSTARIPGVHPDPLQGVRMRGDLVAPDERDHVVVLDEDVVHLHASLARSSRDAVCDICATSASYSGTQERWMLLPSHWFSGPESPSTPSWPCRTRGRYRRSCWCTSRCGVGTHVGVRARASRRRRTPPRRCCAAPSPPRSAPTSA